MERGQPAGITHPGSAEWSLSASAWFGAGSVLIGPIAARTVLKWQRKCQDAAMKLNRTRLRERNQVFLVYSCQSTAACTACPKP